MSNYVLNWNISNRCNLRCKHCAMANSHDDNDLDLKSNKLILKRLIDECNVKTAIFSSLEPFKYDGIFELLKYCNIKEVATGIITNGVLLNEEYIKKLIDVNLTYMALSIEGVSPQSNDIIRGHKTFDIVMKNIKAIEKIFVESNRTFQLSLEINIHKKNIYEINDFISFFNKMNFRIINVGEISNIGNASSNTELLLSESEREIAMRKLIRDYAINGNGTYKLIVKSFMVYETIYYNVLYNISLLIARPICPISNGSGLSLSYDGKISACSFVGYDNNISTSVKDIPQNEIMETLNYLNDETKKKLRYSHEISQVCGDCKYSNSCTICPLAYNDDSYKVLIERCNKYRTILSKLVDIICSKDIPFYISNNVYLNVGIQNLPIITYINLDGSFVSEEIPYSITPVVMYWFSKKVIYSSDNNGNINVREAVKFLVLNGFVTIFGGKNYE